MGEQDSSTIRAAQAGNAEAFRQIVVHNQEFLFRVAFQILADEDDARDATQECFIRAWKNLAEFDTRKRLGTWLYKIIANICYDELRRAYKKRKRPLDERVLSQKSEDDLERQTMNTALVQKINNLAGHLKPRQRMVFVLRDLQQFEMAEIADLLGISIGAVKSNLFYARKNIREKMQKLGFVP